jgi:hypothetical protein
MGMEGSVLENILDVVCGQGGIGFYWFLDRKVICTGNKW